jgi:hypothetical protein
MSMRYNIIEVIGVSAKLDQMLQEMKDLSAEELQLLYKALLAKMAIPLNNPEDVFSDWNDPEVDAAYGKTW